MPIVLAIATAVLAPISGRIWAEQPEATRLSKTEFLQLSAALQLKNQPWATIPWKVSLTAARQLAFKESKPIFLVVNTGNCLGWT
jgi:hypothetical protein